MGYGRLLSALLVAAAFSSPMGASAQQPVAASASQQKEWLMGGGSSGATLGPYFQAVANSVNKISPTLRVTITENGGYANNLAMLRAGKLQLAAVAPNLLGPVDAGSPKDLRALWYTVPHVQDMLVVKGAGITDMAQLEGKCFSAGPTGSSSEETMLEILHALDIKPALLNGMPNDILTAIAEGRCLGMTRAQTTARLDISTAALAELRQLVPLGWNDEQQAKIRTAFPDLTMVNVPADLVPGAPAFVTHATWAAVAATRDEDPEMVYQVMKGMAAAYAEEQQILPTLRSLPLDVFLKRTLDVSSFPLHPGAMRFYREMGLTVPQRLVPAEWAEANPSP